MALFKVVDVIDGNTIQVNGWEWGEFSGNKVKILGYKIQEGDGHSDFAKRKLEVLLKEKSVELKNPSHVHRDEVLKEFTIYCSVYLNDIDISQYFPELTTPTT